MEKTMVSYGLFSLGVVAIVGHAASAQLANPPSATGQPTLASLNPALGEKLADAKPGELRVFATAGIMMPLEAIREDAQRAAGRPLRIQYGSARGDIKNQIEQGQSFDVAILLPDVIHDAGVASKVGAREYKIARIPVGIGFRGEVPVPDVSTPDALKKAMVNAHSIKYQPSGAARDTVERVISSLGLAGSINDVSAIAAPVPLSPGQYEISIYPISELMLGKRYKSLGLVPASLQVPVEITAVISKDADAAASRAFLQFLKGPQMDLQLKSGGMLKAR